MIIRLFIFAVLLGMATNAFAQGRFIGDLWIPDSSLVPNNFNFAGNVGIGTTVARDKLDVTGGKIVIEQTNATDATFKFVCNQAAVETCSCYGTTVSNKVGAIQVNINGVKRWLRIYDDPN